MSAQWANPAKVPKKQFTAEEDAAMVHFLARHSRDNQQALNMGKCWTEFRNKCKVHHPLGAIRNRFRRNLVPKLYKWPHLTLEDKVLIFFGSGSAINEQFQMELEIDGCELVLDECRRIIKYSKLGGLNLARKPITPRNRAVPRLHNTHSDALLGFLEEHSQRIAADRIGVDEEDMEEIEELDEDDDIIFDGYETTTSQAMIPEETSTSSIQNHSQKFAWSEADSFRVEQKARASVVIMPEVVDGGATSSAGTPSSSTLEQPPPPGPLHLLPTSSSTSSATNIDGFMSSVVEMFAAQKDALEAHAEMIKKLMSSSSKTPSRQFSEESKPTDMVTPSISSTSSSSTSSVPSSSGSASNSTTISKKVYLHLLKSLVSGMDGVELDGPRLRINEAIRRLGDTDEQVPLQKVQMSLEAVLGWISC